jgi:DNA polymerase III delta subunit
VENVYAILGSDSAMISKRAQLVVKAVAGENADEFSLDICEVGDKVSPIKGLSLVLESIQTPPFLAGCKTIWLKNFPFDLEGPKSAKDEFNVLLRLLSDEIQSGLPDDINLILSGCGIDCRKSFYKTLKSSLSAQSLEIFEQPKITDRNWQQAVRQTIKMIASENKLNLANDAVEHLLNVFGVNTGCIENELAKISCYCGELSPIRQRDILDISRGDRETEFYAFGSALGQRNLNDAMYSIKRLFNHSKDDSVAIGILTQASNSFRLMLQVKLFMGITKCNAYSLGATLKSLNPQLKERAERSCPLVLSGNAYMLKFKAEDAARYSGAELVSAIHILTDASCKCVSATVPRRLLLEHVALQIIQK